MVAMSRKGMEWKAVFKNFAVKKSLRFGLVNSNFRIYCPFFDVMTSLSSFTIDMQMKTACRVCRNNPGWAFLIFLYFLFIFSTVFWSL